MVTRNERVSGIGALNRAGPFLLRQYLFDPEVTLAERESFNEITVRNLRVIAAEFDPFLNWMEQRRRSELAVLFVHEKVLFRWSASDQ